MKKHFVTFYSPGTFVSESTTLPIESWDVEKAKEMFKDIRERHGAIPFGFIFSTKERKDNELDSKVTKTSGTYFLNGKILTLKELKDRNDPKDRIAISNMECNGYDKMIINDNSWRSVHYFDKDDVLLKVDIPKK